MIAFLRNENEFSLLYLLWSVYLSQNQYQFNMLLSTDSLIVDEAAQIQNLNYTKLPQRSCQNVLGAQFVVLF